MNVTGEEKFVMRAAFDAGFSVEQAAAKVGRSRRTVTRYFAFFSGKPWVDRDRRTPTRRMQWPPPKPLNNPARFYTSEFKPT